MSTSLEKGDITMNEKKITCISYRNVIENMDMCQIIEELSSIGQHFTKENFNKVIEIAWEMIEIYDADTCADSMRELISRKRNEYNWY